MDQQGFRRLLEGRKAPDEKVEPALALAERFEQFAAQQGGSSTATAWAFSNMLITEGENSGTSSRSSTRSTKLSALKPAAR